MGIRTYFKCEALYPRIPRIVLEQNDWIPDSEFWQVARMLKLKLNVNVFGDSSVQGTSVLFPGTPITVASQVSPWHWWHRMCTQPRDPFSPSHLSPYEKSSTAAEWSKISSRTCNLICPAKFKLSRHDDRKRQKERNTIHYAWDTWFSSVAKSQIKT